MSWIKIDTSLHDKPEVFVISEALKVDRDSVVGKLIRVWAWADTHTQSGNATCVTVRLVDAIAQCDGFANAMEKTGWLMRNETGFSFPNFDRHNGNTAKARALTAKRVADYKKRGNDLLTPAALPREEKIREENISLLEAKNPKTKAVLLEGLATSQSILDGEKSELSKQANDVVARWNATPGLKNITKLTLTRRNKLMARLRLLSWPWREGLSKLPLAGDGWQPDFDWFIANEDNVLKIVEGKYDWRSKASRSNSDDHDRVAEAERTKAAIEKKCGVRLLPPNNLKEALA